jgi:16S rRNA (uracil1498-N3)-methyltransferase
VDAGFVPLCLGPRILRTETAALAALAAIQTLWGDLG